VCGSASKVDHVVNFHGEFRDAKVLFVSCTLDTMQSYSSSGQDVEADDNSDVSNIELYAHAGFLNAALELKGQLSTRIENCLKQKPGTNILFTAHSAGGAVASLLNLSFRKKFATTCKSLTRSLQVWCI
jgi:putative lipase involved disintegration of autophagic bodies